MELLTLVREKMETIIYEILPKGDQPYECKIIASNLCDEHGTEFALLLEVWPDEYKYSGPKTWVLLSGTAGSISPAGSNGDLVGYDLVNAETDASRTRLSIYCTTRQVVLDKVLFSIKKLVEV